MLIAIQWDVGAITIAKPPDNILGGTADLVVIIFEFSHAIL